MTFPLGSLGADGAAEAASQAGRPPRWGTQFVLLGGGVLWLLLLLSLLSHQATDPGFSTSGLGGPVLNKAGALGAWATSVVSPEVMRWALGLSFLGMAVWTMFPDKIEEEETRVAKHLGVFGATLVTFFLAEMGDKTQLATIALAAHYAAPVVVVIGTTSGMLIADVPAVFIGNRFAAAIPMKLVHTIAAGIFAHLDRPLDRAHDRECAPLPGPAPPSLRQIRCR